MNFPKILFQLSILGVAYLYGNAAAAFGLFPAPFIQETTSHIRELFANVEVETAAENQNKNLEVEPLAEGAWLLVRLGEKRIDLRRDENETLLSWSLEPLEKAVSGLFDLFPSAAELLPDGDLLVMAGQLLKGFEVSSVVARLDKTGRVKWVQNELPFHHWFQIKDGKVILPVRVSEEVPEEVMSVCPHGGVLNEGIAVMDLETGRLLESFSILSAVAKLPAVFKAMANWRCPDLLHLNHVTVLSEFEARKIPGGNPGDYMVSLASVDAVVVIDKDTKLAKWSIRGQFKHQHSPQINQRGNVVVFDNRGGKSPGATRLVEVDPRTKEVVGEYAGSPHHRFESNIRGLLSIRKNSYYVTSSEQGEVFSLECPTAALTTSCAFKLRVRTPSKLVDAEYYSPEQIRSLLGAIPLSKRGQ